MALVREQQHAAVVLLVEISQPDHAEALTVVRGGVHAGVGAVVEPGAVGLGPAAVDWVRTRLVDVLHDHVVLLHVQVVHSVDGGLGGGGQDGR